MQTTVKLLIDSQNNSLTFSKNFRIFSTDEPITGIVEFTEFIEDLIYGSPNIIDLANLIRKIRYSRNKLDWSLWYAVAPGNIGDSANMILDSTDPFYFQVRYEYDDGTTNQLPDLIQVNEIKLRFKSSPGSIDVFAPKVRCSNETYSSIIANRDPSFRPYEVDSAISMFKDLSFFTNQIYGHQVVYFRTLPESDSGDYVFKEWTLYKNVDRKCIKVLVPGNTFPENTPKYTEFGMDFQLPFEIHLDHKYFQSIFGSCSEPRKRDFLYFPLINRMYEIQGSYLSRGFMMEPVFWKVQLKKFSQNIDMLLTDTSRSFLDNVIVNADQLFSDEVEKDIKDSTMPAQYQKITTTFDSSRKAIHPDVIQRPLKYTFNFAPLIENYYDLGGVPANEITAELLATSPLLSTTQSLEQLPNLDSSSLPSTSVIIAYEGSPIYTTWRNNGLLTNDKNVKASSFRYCRVRGPFDSISNHEGESETGRFIRIEAYRDLSFKDPKDILTDTVSGKTIVKFKVREPAIVYSATPKFNNTLDRNLSFTCLFNVPSSSGPINFIDGFDSDSQSGIQITGNFTRYISTEPEGLLTISVKTNSQVKNYSIANFTSGQWHAIVVSISNEFLQCGTYVYRIVEDPSDIINHNEFVPILQSTSSFSLTQFEIDQNYILPNSNLLITNIRVFNTMLKEEEHDFILSQQFLRDESMLVLIDNCRVQTNLPYIVKNR